MEMLDVELEVGHIQPGLLEPAPGPVIILGIHLCGTLVVKSQNGALNFVFWLALLFFVPLIPTKDDFEVCYPSVLSKPSIVGPNVWPLH